MRRDMTVTAGRFIQQTTTVQQWSDELFMRAQLGQVEYKALNSMSYQLCLVNIRQADGGDVEEALLSHFSLVIQSIVEQQAFRLFTHMQHGQIALLLFDFAPAKSRTEQLIKKEVLSRMLQKVYEAVQRSSELNISVNIGISSTGKGFKNVQFCYEEALKALSLKPLFDTATIFYEELGAFQLLLYLQEQGLLASYVARHLGPILEEDERKNSDLFKTLKVYLESNGSKKSVADELHIVRQSLYYRLEKMKELLGEDYMCTHNRLALQLAIQAYELLKCSEKDR